MLAKRKLDLTPSRIKENNASLVRFFDKMGIQLNELEDWNCCGSSPVHCLDTGLSIMLPARNLALAPSDRPLLVACPNCLLRLKTSQRSIAEDKALQGRSSRKPSAAISTRAWKSCMYSIY